MSVIVTLVCAYLAVVPIGYLLWNSLSSGGRFSASAFHAAFTMPGAWDVIADSLVFAIGTAAMSMFFGTTIAYLVTRTDMRMRGFVTAVMFVPLMFPGLLYAVGWIFIASPEIGWLNSDVLNHIGIRFNVFSMLGMVVVESLHVTPIVFLLMTSSFRSMDAELEEAAMVSGAPARLILRRITLALSAPTAYATAMLIAILTLGTFEVPAVIGAPSGILTLTAQIWKLQTAYPPHQDVSSAYSIALLILVLLALFGYSRITRRTKAFATIRSRGFRPRRMPLRGLRPVALAFCLFYLIVGVLLPMATLVYASTQRFYQPPSAETLSNMTLNAYRNALSDDTAVGSILNSVKIGAASATAVIALLALGLWASRRANIVRRWLLESSATAPIVVPGIVLSQALLFLYLRAPITITGTLWILFIAQMTRYLPYGARYVSSSLHQVSLELEDAAVVSGASWWQTFRRVNLPLMMPGIVAGWLFIFLISLRELASIVTLSGPNTELLPIFLFSRWQAGDLVTTAALGVLLVLGMFVIAGIIRLVGGRVGTGFDRG